MAWIDGDAGSNLLVGTPDEDNINGYGGNDTLQGLGGDDRLLGGPGNDSLEGGPGNDFLYLDEGADYANGGIGSDTFRYYSSDDTIVGGAGIDFVVGSTYTDLTTLPVGQMLSVEGIIGTYGDDTLLGDDNDNDLRGGDGDDRLFGRDGNDLLSGGAGDDSLYGGAGDDTLVGNSYDDDVADYSSVTSALVVDLRDGTATSADGTEGNDTLTGVARVLGGLGDDSIFGSNGADDLRGRQGNDLLQARAGDDTLDGGLGQDFLRGGSGSDTARYTSHARGMTIDLANLTAYAAGTSALTDVLASIENAVGGSGNDSLIGSGIGQSLDGGKGNDTVEGGAGDDTLAGDLGNDIVRGEDGNDTIVGARVLYPYYDDYNPDPSYETFISNLIDDGADTLDGGAGSDTLLVSGATYYGYEGGSDGRLHVAVDLAAGTLTTNLENATTDQLVSIENVELGDGDDTVTGTSGANHISVGDGSNVVRAGAGNDTVVGGDEYNPDATQAYQDEIYGQAGNDMLVGNNTLRDYWETYPAPYPSGNDYLNGGAGDDTLVGGFWSTQMVGGSGADHFQSSDEYFEWSEYGYVIYGFAERPVILDFDSDDGDKLVISIVSDEEYGGDFTPSFAGEVADLETLDNFEFGYVYDGNDLVARFVSDYGDDLTDDDDLHIRLTDYSDGLTADDVLFV